jgi:hypothetical protein
MNLVAERRLRDVEARGGAAEVEFLRDGKEIAKKARFEIDSARLSLVGQQVVDTNQPRATA